jgi:hypothetical protein
MADNIAITAGSGTTVATDDVSGVHYQRVKLVNGTLDDATAITGDAQGLHTVARRDLLRIAVDSGGLTTSTTAYTAGDQVGTQFTLANAARASGGSGTIIGVQLMDQKGIIGSYDVVFTRSSVTPASDNAAFSLSTTDVKAVTAIVQLGGSWDFGTPNLTQAFGLAIPYDCSGGTSLFANLICRVGHTFFTASTDLQLVVWVERN